MIRRPAEEAGVVSRAHVALERSRHPRCEAISRKPYDEEWAVVFLGLTLLPEDAGHRENSLREVFNGLRYVVETGVRWRWIPNDLPPWSCVCEVAPVR